jgi:AAA+ ATPase superfamily predicted ATPase
MEFIDREKELELLGEIRRRSEKSARMTVITGRRRIGKTTLANRAYEKGPFLYFFVVRKNEVLLCQEFVEEITRALGVNVPALRGCLSISLLIPKQIRSLLLLTSFRSFRM